MNVPGTRAAVFLRADPDLPLRHARLFKPQTPSNPNTPSLLWIRVVSTKSTRIQSARREGGSNPRHPVNNARLVPTGTPSAQGGRTFFFPFYFIFFSKTCRNLNFRQKKCHNRKSNTVQRWRGEEGRGEEAVVRFELPVSGNSPKVCLRNWERFAPFKKTTNP